MEKQRQGKKNMDRVNDERAGTGEIRLGQGLTS